MKYIALLRGINVGGNKRVEMKRLKTAFEVRGYKEVSTYINSGNVIFSSGKSRDAVRRNIEEVIKKEFGFEIKLLIKTASEMRRIAEAIPPSWKNDSKQRTDVAYLFNKIDRKEIVGELPIKKEFMDVRYVSGAIFWNILRKNYNRSHLNKLIGHKLYQDMTVRNVNTARYLAKV
jgi:uncharacterized protein (DUF1697 family)